MSRLRLGWFTTGRGPGSFAMLRTIVKAIESGALEAELAVLFSNRERGEAEATDRLFAYAQDHGIPVVGLSSVGFRKERGGERSSPGEPLPAWRGAYDEALADALWPYAFDLGVLAGYMLITTPDFCTRYPLLNLHPAAPGGPIGTWQEVIWSLIEEKATTNGVSVHVVTPELDEGPIAAFCRYALVDDDTRSLWADVAGMSGKEIRKQGEDLPLFAAIRRMGLQRESPALLATLRAAAQGRFRVEPGIVVSTEGRSEPLDLSEEVEAALRAATHG